ncbi:MAG: hypothetical protein IPN73_10100 [Saprospiraceae bacterium]|nr:hypothetical protein [Saprospiraceae bacterium]MBK8850496.1 hypothetical protein [Saprospiraceae bacterium]
MSNGNTQQIIITHEISTLWEMFKKQTSFEPRFLESINEIEEYINDFSQIDDTGEVFRYPLTAGGDKHLQHLNVVNLLSFKERYIELSSKLKTLDYYSSFLITEYEQRTFVGNLSRDVISKIATDLPNIESWKASDGNFTKIKEEIKQKYDLSSTTLSKVINLIKENFEFAPLIGKELIITDISINELKDFFELYEEFLIERHTNDSNNTIESKSTLIKEKVSQNAIYSLAQLYDIGYFRLYPEEYEKGLEMKKNEDVDVLIRYYLLGNGIVKEKILAGLKICRQTKLLESL